MSTRRWPMRAARVCVAAGLLWALAGGSANALPADDKQEPPSTSRGAVTPQQQAPKDNGQANNAPIKITAIGNKLYITSDDPKALATAQELVRLLTQRQSGQGDYETIKLKYASATEAAKALDEAFNGPRQQSTQPEQGSPGAGFGGRGGGRAEFFGPFAAAGAAPPSNPSPNTIRVVAYPPTNTLVVRANPMDMVRIRRLLKNAIDTEDSDSKAIMRTWILQPLQFATATDVATILREVYREYTNNNPQPAQVGGFPGFGFSGFGFPGGGPQNANVDADGNPRAIRLSVGVDDRANRIIVNCSESVYEEVQKLVDQLDSGTRNATRTVRVVPLHGIDPLLVQQAIDAIQGRRASPARPGVGQTAPGSGSFGRGGLAPGMTPTAPTPGGGAPPWGGGPPEGS